MTGMTKEEALNRVAKMCSRREYCSVQIGRYLGKLVGSDDAESILSSLVNGGYIDDMRFIKAYARDKARFGGWGKEKIIFRLRAMGLEGPIRETVNEALGTLDMDKQLRTLLERKWSSIGKSVEPIARKRARLIRFALQRGYDYDSVYRIIGEFS